MKYLSIILLIVGLVAGFAGGYYFKNYQQNKLRNNLRNGADVGQRFVPNGDATGQRGGGFAGGISGDIISMDDKSVTVKLNDGSTKIVLLGESTTYSNLLDAKKEDIKEGTKIMVIGSSNSDGSLTAQRIQLNPIVTSPSNK